MYRRAGPVLLALALAAGGYLLLRQDAGSGVGPAVLLVTFDTTRADALGEGRQLFALEAFLTEATRFSGLRAAAPLTLPTHLSIFSGLLPANHGIHDNVTSPMPLDRGFPLLAEEFRDAGYRTAAFTAYAVMAPRTGAVEGFDHFDGPTESRAENDAAGQLSCEDRTDAALAWLRALPAETPYFLWVHYFDPHSPYLAWKGDARRDGTEPGQSTRELYAGEVRRMDASFERLLEGVSRETIVVLATDHGEGLGEHDEPAHGPLCFSSVIDAFLAVRGPGMKGGATSTGPRSQADIAPTLRRWCGLPAQPTDGLPLDGPPHALVVSESLYTWRIHGWGQCFSVSDGRYTLVESGESLLFFDHANDPGERTPLDPSGHEAYERLDRGLAEFRAQRPSEIPVAALQDSGTPYGAARRPLSTFLSRQENARLPDPRKRFPYWSVLDATMEVIMMGRQRGDKLMLGKTIATLETLAEQDPENPAPWSYLVYAQGGMAEATGIARWNRDAARSAREAMARGYLVATILKELLSHSLAGGDPVDLEEALALAFEKRIVPDLECVELFVRLSLASRAEGAKERARTYLERARLHFPRPGESEALDRLAARLG